MAEEEEKKAKDEKPKKEEKADSKEESSALDSWQPRTEIGKLVKEGKITNIDEILDNGYNILEQEITEALLPGLESELLLIGQSKGKFGGGQRRVFKQTQKKTREGNRPKFSTVAVVGNKNGYIGIGFGKSKETVPAREKALRNAKLNIIKIRRGSGSWEDASADPHSIPFAVEGKSGSVIVKLLPAPRGTGLVAHKEIQKILSLAGIENIWSKSHGAKKTTMNLIKATEKALRMLSSMKIDSSMKITEGAQEKSLKEEFEEMKEENDK